MLRPLEDVERRSLLHGLAVLHHHDRIGEVGDHAHVVRDEDDRGVESRAQAAQQLEDLGLHRHVERRRRLIGDEEHRVARDRLRDHGALALATRQLVRVLVERGLRVGHLDLLEKLDRALLRSLRRHVVVRAQRLDDLEPDRVDRVERRHGLLEDHGDLVAAHLAQLAVVEAGELAPEELDGAGHLRGRRQKPQERHRARALARARLADDRQDLAALDPIVQADRGGVVLAVDPEVHAEVLDFEHGLDGGGGGGAHGRSFPAFRLRRSAKLASCVFSRLSSVRCSAAC